jgi:hypothetical protein
LRQQENVANGPIPFHRADLRSVIDQVEVDDTEVRIHGRRDVLERLVMGGGAMPAGVPSFVRKWRARKDSGGVSCPAEDRTALLIQRITAMLACGQDEDMFSGLCVSAPSG